MLRTNLGCRNEEEEEDEEEEEEEVDDEDEDEDDGDDTGHRTNSADTAVATAVRARAVFGFVGFFVDLIFGPFFAFGFDAGTTPCRKIHP